MAAYTDRPHHDDGSQAGRVLVIEGDNNVDLSFSFDRATGRVSEVAVGRRDYVIGQEDCVG